MFGDIIPAKNQPMAYGLWWLILIVILIELRCECDNCRAHSECTSAGIFKVLVRWTGPALGVERTNQESLAPEGKKGKKWRSRCILSQITLLHGYCVTLYKDGPNIWKSELPKVCLPSCFHRHLIVPSRIWLTSELMSLGYSIFHCQYLSNMEQGDFQG